MEFFYSSFLSALHSISAVVALVCGGIVFVNAKGTKLHKIYGYVYVISMLSLNVSAIPLQNLFGGIGWFHLFIVMSLPYILWGMYYPIFGRGNPKWMVYHFEVMSYSYVGLLAAFIAEVLVRVPLAVAVQSQSQFVIGIFIVSGICGWVGYKYINGYKVKKFS